MTVSKGIVLDFDDPSMNNNFFLSSLSKFARFAKVIREAQIRVVMGRRRSLPVTDRYGVDNEALTIELWSE